jgi:hypothetical protein
MRTSETPDVTWAEEDEARAAKRRKKLVELHVSSGKSVNELCELSGWPYARVRQVLEEAGVFTAAPRGRQPDPDADRTIERMAKAGKGAAAIAEKLGEGWSRQRVHLRIQRLRDDGRIG